MIDDQQPTDASREMQVPVWSSLTNKVGWGAYLAELHKRGADIPAYAAPARNRDYQDFPPTITFVGTLEPFYWETQAYVKALGEAGVPCVIRSLIGVFMPSMPSLGALQSADKLRRLPTTVSQSSMIAMSMSERINWCGGIERRQTWVTSKRTD